MAKTKKVEDKEAIVQETPVAVQPAPVEVVASSQAAAPVTPTTVIVEKKSGGGCWKWLVCCVVILLLCCMCSLVGGYLLVTRTGDIIRAITTSVRNEEMTRITVQEAESFNMEQYWTEHPNTDLGSNKFEMIVPEEIILQIIAASQEDKSIIEYIGVDIEEGLLSIQIDLGQLMSAQPASNNEEEFISNVKFNAESLKGIYVNIDITVSGQKNIDIKSVRLGESPLDLATLASSMIDDIVSEIQNSEFFTSVDQLEFKDGYIRLVLNADESIDMNTEGY